MFKLIKWLLILIVLLVVAVIVGLYLALNAGVKKVVEYEGTQQLHVDTKLESVSLGIFKGDVGLKSFSLGSPKGFTASQMMSVGSIDVVSGGISNLRAKPVHLNSLTINAPKLVVEQKGNKFNFKELMDGLPSDPDKDKTQPSDQTKVVIDTLSITDAHVVLSLDVSQLGLKKDIDVPLPAMTLKNIGNADGANNGAAVKDVITTIITQMVSQASKQSGIPFPAGIQDLLKGNLASVKDKMTDSAKTEVGKLMANAPGKDQLNGLMNGQQPDLKKTGEGLLKDKDLQNKGKDLLKGFGK